MSLRLRVATASDLPALLALLADDAIARERRGYAAEPSAAVQAAFEEISRDPNNELIVGELEGDPSGAPVACLQLTYIPGLSRGGMRRALVEAVRVRADLRGQGLGEQLMQDAMARARARGCGLIQLTTDKRREAAHRFYARLGFEASHEGMKRSL
ncbi:GNAT family N-acetyltransferase [Aggregicoccus sp. 17bor-14]|uniref:GNAT family N-acetyltransferase n=1 Tax=Myxococcaceae TaxID=31 RepID=UPI00129C38F7|nr:MULTISPECIES: GNAT family N-acetyltransferase [Myxococcaceae]MBF5041844.1 GNAT family N-acetyltransferase [Simulacricoccus sp. 17bor-14]MRI87625.1 GNAT family N-acetyltransferase [Aggregicoccus sp. 17bor-14]